MVKTAKKIETGSRVAIIGGGPAGSFFALYLLHYAAERGIQSEITIYQQRHFDELGSQGCKGCAGIISLTLFKNLSELNLTIPDEVIQSRIEHYTVHSPYTSVSISNPEKEIQIVSVYRGGGPRISHFEKPVSFDGWLLREAQRRGARIENQTVSRIDLEEEPTIEVAGERLKYDLIVLASGVNARAIDIQGLLYVPPRTRIMAQDELYASADDVAARLGNAAHVFLIPRSGLVFGTLVPKGPFINVSVLSSSRHPVAVADFLRHDLVRRVLPEQYQRACGCRPRAVVSSARNYFADGFVALGDAAVSRLYKDGIGSSLLAAREAARTVVYHGTSRDDFEHHYQPFYRSLDRDNRWGKLLFSLNDRVKDSRTFLLAQHRLIGDEQSNVRGPQPFTKAAWGMFTGSYSYRSIARMALSPASLAKLGLAVTLEGVKGWSRKGTATVRKLQVTQRKVLILGSGFGGTYVLRHLVPSLNRNENVETTVVSDENFFLFSPLLHKVAMGAIETRHIAYPIRRLHWRDRFNFVQGNVEKIDLAARKVTTSRGTLDFDYLVLALGSVSAVSELKSPGKNVFTLKTLLDSMRLRNHIVGLFEQASVETDPLKQKQLLTFVVSGGGYIGVQLVTELRDFIYKTLVKVYNTVNPYNIRIILVEAKPKIAAQLHTKLGTYVMKQLQDMGIEVNLRSQVTHVWDDRIEISGEETVPTSTLIWVAGVVASPQIAELDAEKDDIGRVLVNEYLEVPGVPGVYALGDCAHFEHTLGRAIPPRAHTAVRQGKVVAHNILADIRGRDKRPYHYSNPVEMVSLGSSKAVFRFLGVRLYGFPARVVWLVAFSLLVTGTYNRLRILGDWLLSLVFGRDTTFLKLGKP